MTIIVSKLFLYPIKSCRGIPVQSALITPLGFKHDRAYMLVEIKPSQIDEKDGLKEEKWVPMTLRQHPRMGLIRTAIEGDEIIVTAEGSTEKITLPLDPSPEFLSALRTTPTIDLCGTPVEPYILPPTASAFFQSFLSLPTCHLVYVGPSPRAIIINRPPSQAQNGRTITTAFADAGPYLLASEESFEHVNKQLEKKIEIIRFRPNIVVSGAGEWEEDGWKEVNIGDAGKFFVVARCPRCQLPNVDLETGVKDPHQPYKTLSKYRRIDGGAKYSPCFGMLCVSDQLDGVVKVGDEVEVLETGEHFFIDYSKS